MKNTIQKKKEAPMSTKRFQLRAHSERGQTIVLGALGVLVVALMMFITLNVGNSIFEKIRIQQVADSAAFSTATQEARAFNFYAYTNRANIANLVAAMSAHSSMTMANSVPGMFYAARDNFYNFAIREFAFCALCCWPYCFSNCIHCIHGIKDLDAAWNLEDRGDELNDMVEDIDEQLTSLIDLIDIHMMSIAAGQSIMAAGMILQLQGNDIPTKIQEKFARNAELGSASPYASLAFYLKAHLHDEVKEITKYLASEIANGSRHNEPLISLFGNDFLTDRDIVTQALWTFPLTLVPDLLYENTDNVDGLSVPFSHDGEAYTEPGGDSSFTVNSDDKGMVISSAFQCWISMIPWISSYEYNLTTDKDGGDHSGKGFSCDEDHKLSCLDGAINHYCFMPFHADHEAIDFNQPHVYVTISQDLSINGDAEAAEMPWELNASGSVDVSAVWEGPPAKVQIANQLNDGVAISKALVYYHFPSVASNGDGWKEHPNFFNPYWKAKLQPFRASEAALVLTSEGYTDAAILATGGALAGALGLGGVPMP
ncbi:MAG: hypothetical protein JRF33_15385 [Deltaproteobacteria bacterium]|nr:hypothetical protein [Deltaproteobacteria bacterium]